VSVTVVDKNDNTASAYTIYITNLSTTWGTFNAAPTLGRRRGARHPGDHPDRVGRLARPRRVQGRAAADRAEHRRHLQDQRAARTCTLVVVNGAGTPTFTTGDLVITLGFRQVAVS
jgi:hypothetical protein